jgi:hypothetical protein
MEVSMKKFVIVTVLFVFVLSVSVLAGDIKFDRVHKITAKEEAQFIKMLQEITNYTSPAATNRQGPIEIGRTWYDYPGNTTTGRMMAHALTTTDGQDGIHVTFMKILPQGAERYVTYDYFDLGLNLFFGNQSINELLGRSGWGRMLNGRDDEALVGFHTNTLGGTHVFADAGEASYTFSSKFDTVTTDGSVFPGIARNGDILVFMSHGGIDWLTDPIVVTTTDYMVNWVPKSFPPQDPLTTDVGHSEIWPAISPVNTDEFSFMTSPDVTASAANGSLVLNTTGDFGNSYASTQILDDDEVFEIDGNHTQYIVENFSQGWGIYTPDGTYHVAFGAVQGIIDTLNSTLIDLFPILYWNDRDQNWVEITSDAADTPTDTTTINGMGDFRPGNGLGNAYPILSQGPNNDLVCIWQQWEDDGTGKMVTQIVPPGVEIFLTDIWGAYSPDGGQSWSEPFLVAGNPGESDVYPNITSHFLWNASGDSIILDMLYMHDTNPSASLSGFTTQTDPSECVWYYERVAIDSAKLKPITPTTARLQVIHNAADPAAATVDVYVNDAIFIDDFDFRTATAFQDVPAGVTLNIGVAPGNSGSAADTLVNIPVVLSEGGTFAAIANGVLDPNSFAPNPDGISTAFQLLLQPMAREAGGSSTLVDFYAVHGSTDAPTVDINAQGFGTIFDNVPYTGVSDYTSVPEFNYVIEVADSSSSTVVASFQADLSAAGGQALSVIASGFLDPSSNQNGPAFGLIAVFPDGSVLELPPVTTGIEEIGFNNINTFELEQNYPNPFNPATTIVFSIPSSELVELKVYNIVGQEIAILVNEPKQAGKYSINFDASELASGIYLYKIKAGSFQSTKRMILLK